jgi:hypothetical protein
MDLSEEFRTYGFSPERLKQLKTEAKHGASETPQSQTVALVCLQSLGRVLGLDMD